MLRRRLSKDGLSSSVLPAPTPAASPQAASTASSALLCRLVKGEQARPQVLFCRPTAAGALSSARSEIPVLLQKECACSAGGQQARQEQDSINRHGSPGCGPPHTLCMRQSSVFHVQLALQLACQRLICHSAAPFADCTGPCECPQTCSGHARGVTTVCSQVALHTTCRCLV